jgi:hypothetical protein
MMPERCRLTSAHSGTLGNVAPVYSSSRRASGWGQPSTSSCSSGWRRKHRNGKIGWYGCQSEISAIVSATRGAGQRLSIGYPCSTQSVLTLVAIFGMRAPLYSAWNPTCNITGWSDFLRACLAASAGGTTSFARQGLLYRLSSPRGGECGLRRRCLRGA